MHDSVKKDFVEEVIFDLGLEYELRIRIRQMNIWIEKKSILNQNVISRFMEV